MRSRLGRRTLGLAHAAAHDGHGQNGLHVVQPGSRRSCQRSDCQRDRCIGRSDGPHHRPDDRPVPDAQSFERRRDVESPGAMRQNPLLGGVAAYAGKHPKPLYLAGCGDRTAVRRHPAHGFRATGHPGRRSEPESEQPPVCRANAPYHGGPDPHGRRIHLPRRRAHLGNFPRRTDALRSFARRRRQGGGRRFARNHRVPSPNRFRKRTHENRDPGASRRPDHRLRTARTPVRRRKSGQILVFT